MEPIAHSQGLSATKAVRVLVVDDHPLFRSGISALLAEENDFEICGEAGEAHAALAAFRALQPDVVVMDISMPGADGIELTKMMVAEQPKAAILIFSAHDEMLYAMRALRAGAKGYVQKCEPPATLLCALRRLCQDAIHVSERVSARLIFKAIHSEDNTSESPLHALSDRELEVFHWIAKGSGTREIADTLNLSVKTVETHRAHIKEKLGLKDANEMVRFAKEWQSQNDDQH
jgi:DNA-binding NarL/FixJ family response regulator